MRFPKTHDEWHSQGKLFSVPHKLSHEYFPSGSKFSTKHYYALRAIYPPIDRDTKNECFPPSSIRQVRQTLDTYPQLQQAFKLLDRKSSEWTSQDLLDAGSLGPSLAQLQLIINRPGSPDSSQDPDQDDVGFRKIINSPRAVKSVKARTTLAVRSKTIDTPLTPTPAPRKPPGDLALTTDLSSWLENTPALSTPAPATLPGSGFASTSGDYSIFDGDFESAMFEVGDEQTVNACLVNLLLPVTWACEFSKSVHLDRKPFYLGPEENAFYQACVDGVIIIHDSVKGFMEVKRGVRGRDSTVRMQESAQMAAYIYTQGPKI